MDDYNDGMHVERAAAARVVLEDLLRVSSAILARLDLEAREREGTYPCAAMREDLRAALLANGAEVEA